MVALHDGHTMSSSIRISYVAAKGSPRVQFLILGAITALFSGVVYVWLPDSPVKAPFLSEQERVIAVKRVASNKTGISEPCLSGQITLEA